MHYIIILLILATWSPPIPDLNKQIIIYVDSVIGKKVGHGECWDLAAAALEYSGAYFDRSSQKTIYTFGKEINYKKDEIYPGDIIQLEKVKLEYIKGNTIHTETMTHHTAIIYEVIGDNFKIAHQNTSFSGKKVGISNFNIKNVKSGKITFYRPYKK